MATPTFQITSSSLNLNIISGQTAQLVLNTDINPPSTPSPITVTLQVTGLVPNVDFSMPNFTWVNAGTYWQGTYSINYNAISPTSPLSFTLTPLNNSQYGNVLGTITLVAATGYTVGSDYVLNYDLQGNPQRMFMLPGLVTFDEALNVGITSMAVVQINNVLNVTEYVNKLQIPQDLNLAATILVDNGSANIFSWDKWGAITSKQISAYSNIRIAILLNSAIPLDLTGWTLDMDINDGNTPVHRESYSYAFESNTVNAISVVSNKINIGNNSFTWIDGTLKPPKSPTSCGQYANLGKTGSVTGSATIPVIVQNINTDVCPDGCSTGNIRVGDMINGWYPSLITNDSGNISLGLSALSSDSGYVLAENGTVIIPTIVGTNASSGVHSAQYNFLFRECQNPAIITTTSLSNPNVSFSGGNPSQIKNGGGSTDLVPIPISNTIQGYDQSSCLNTASIGYTWSGEFSGTITKSNTYYSAPLTRTYSFTVQLGTADTPLATQRDIAMFINGGFYQLLTSNKRNIFIETEITVALTSGDQVSFAAYCDASLPVDEIFGLIVRYEQKANLKPVISGCQTTLEYNIFNQNITTLTPPVNLTGASGTNQIAKVTLQNNEDNPEVISNIAITGLSDFTSTGLTLPVTIAPGGNYTFYFTWSPLTNYGTVNAEIVFTCNIGTYTENITVNAKVGELKCSSIGFSSSLYSVNVFENIQQSFATLVQFSSGSYTGLLTINNTSGSCNSITFSGGATEVNINVSAGIPVYIPINVLSTTCPGSPISCSIPYMFVVENAGYDEMCSGTLNIQTNVTCVSETTCPAQFAPSVVDISNLIPSGSGSFSVNFLLSDTVANLGLSVVDFELPSGETILTFGTLVNIPGELTWSTISSTHVRATLIIPSNPLTFITIPLNYTIPSGGTISYTHSSDLIAISTFANDAYVCNTLTEPITLGVVIQPSTFTGFEAAVTYTTIDNCKTIQINDTSLYGSGNCFQINDFTLFRQITIINPDGTTYVMSTQMPYNQLIAPAYNNGSPIYAYNYDVSSQGGVYSVTIATVPTYNNVCTWNVGDCCCLMDLTISGQIDFFIATQVSSGVIPLSTPGWQTYWNEITINDLQAPYTATTFYVNTCNIQNCFSNMAQGVFCDFENICNRNMCEDQCQMNFYKLIMIEYLINMAITNGDYDALTAYYNLATTLCQCPPCGNNNPIQSNINQPCHK